jgi:hypothetical protein
VLHDHALARRAVRVAKARAQARHRAAAGDRWPYDADVRCALCLSTDAENEPPCTHRMVRRKTRARLRNRLRYGPTPATARSSRVADGFASSCACGLLHTERSMLLSAATSLDVCSTAARSGRARARQQRACLHVCRKRRGKVARRNLAACTNGRPQRREVRLVARITTSHSSRQCSGRRSARVATQALCSVTQHALSSSRERCTAGNFSRSGSRDLRGCRRRSAPNAPHMQPRTVRVACRAEARLVARSK